jgi:hypothetical protein
MRVSPNGAVSAAMLTIGLPGAYLIGLLVLAGITFRISPVSMLLLVLLLLPIIAGITFVAGYGIGWFANYWFRQTKTSPEQMATVIALIFDCTFYSSLIFLLY